MDRSRQYWVHNGYSGWAYGTPSDPQLICVEDAARIIAEAHLSPDHVSFACPAAQYAEVGDRLFEITGGNRFLFHGFAAECVEVKPEKVATPLAIEWASGQ